MRHNKKAAKHHFAPAKEEAVSLQSILKSACCALLLAIGIGLLLLLLFTALLLLTENPGAYARPAALAALYLTALFMGAIATRLHQRRLPLFCGITSGGLLLLALLLTALFLPKASPTGIALQTGLYAAIPFLATAGALLAARRPRTVKRPKRRF